MVQENSSYVSNFFDGLLADVEDGGKAAKARIIAVAREADMGEEISAAYISLAAWGSEGFDDIVRLASELDTVKSKSNAIITLSQIAEVGYIAKGYFVDERIIHAVNRSLVKVDRKLARNSLSTLIFDTPTEDLMIPLSQAYMKYSLLRIGVPNLLSSVISSKWLRFGPAALDEYENMLETKTTNEPAFQEFFTTYPQMLDPMVVRAWTQPSLNGAQEPDFVLQRADDTYLVVEIECPSKLLVRKDGQLSAEATHAEKQTNDYATFLNERMQQARQIFPNYRAADKMAVVGMQRDLDINQSRSLKTLNESRHKLVTVGFDWLLDRARSVLRNLSDGEIQVSERTRMF